MSVCDQLWVSNEPPDPEKVKPIEPPEEAVLQKPEGGLWTSPLRDGTCGWIEWMQGERWCPVDEPEAWRLTVADDVELYTIDSVGDLEAITTAPADPRWGPAGIMNHTIDWQGVFEDHDGIHLTREGQVATRFTGRETPDLYGWDCECVLWDGWHFEDVAYFGSVEIPEVNV